MPSQEDVLTKLGRELREAGRMLDQDQARFLVNTYYDMQEHRIALNNQVRSLDAAGKPSEVMQHMASQMSVMEKQLVSVLDRWTDSHEVGRWSRAQMGIGPILAAGLMAHIDIHRAPTVSHIWRFAGLDPTFEWLGRERAHALVLQAIEEFGKPGRGGSQKMDWNDLHVVEWVAVRANRKSDAILKIASNPAGKVTAEGIEKALSLRPWNADLKKLCWLIGDSFVKVSNREGAYYGSVYRRRKAWEQLNNEQQKYADQAADTMRKKRITAPDTKKWYDKGMLPPGRIDLRARRYAVKLFLSHWHHVAYVETFGKEPPAPYAIQYLGHADYLPPPPGA